MSFVDIKPIYLNKRHLFQNKIYYLDKIYLFLKDTHREKAPSNKTPTLSKIMNINIWVVGTSNQLFIGGS